MKIEVIGETTFGEEDDNVKNDNDAIDDDDQKNAIRVVPTHKTMESPVTPNGTLEELAHHAMTAIVQHYCQPIHYHSILQPEAEEEDQPRHRPNDASLPPVLSYWWEQMMNNDNNNDNSMLPHPDKILVEFQPHLLQQHEATPHVQCANFGLAVTLFFQQLAAQKQAQKLKQVEQAAEQRYTKIQQDQAQRMAALQRDILGEQARAMAVQQHAEQVDQALAVVNSALHSGMDWDQLHEVVRVEQEEHFNPIALLIHELKLEDNIMVLKLPTTEDLEERGQENDDETDDESHQENDTEQTTILVPVSLEETAHANASRLFSQYRAAKDKSQKTIENLSKAMEAAQEKAERQLQQAAQQRQTASHATAKKTLWFEKFRWMVTTDNYLVIAGKDAHQNETLVKRYLRKGDAYLHADVHGAASCILRAKRRKNTKSGGGNTIPLPLSDQALREAGQFTICHSSAWNSRMVTSAWWVHSHQVSKTAPSGEYLTVGSFMVRGKKNYLPPTQLEMGLAVLFRLGNAESIARHRNKDRRDFMLLADEDGFVRADDEQTETVAPRSSRSEQRGRPNLPENKSNDTPLEENPLSDAAWQPGSYPASQDGGGNGRTENTSPVQNEVNDQEQSEPTKDTTDENAKDEQQSASTPGSGQLEHGPMPKKKGLSARDRRLIKKYGSLQEAERILADRNAISCQGGNAEEESVFEAGTVSTMGTNNVKRGKKGKLKRQKQRYADQDDEDRELALLLLQGGGGKKGRKQQRDLAEMEPQNETEVHVGAETVAILGKDSSQVADKLSEAVRSKLIECLRDDSDPSGEAVRWGRIDGDVLEQLVGLDSEEAQLAAVTRLLSFKDSMKTDSFTMSLAGVIRTVRKYGCQDLNSDKSARKDANANGNSQEALTGPGKQKQEQSNGEDDDEWAREVDLDEDEIDDTAELDKLTGKPLAKDLLLHAVPVCAPYSTLSQYQFRVKLTPGNGKRGKAAKQCVELMLQQLQLPGKGGKNVSADNKNQMYRDFIKRVSDSDWVSQMMNDVKISSAGSSKLMKKQQQKGGKGGRNKKK
mmetsp:Transcript_5106/g.14375  ORF Transcript_5106/g.14375 Transcript_5106/m.14375 type:complete len:1050 (-) Transcript_5106:494-3643(-)